MNDFMTDTAPEAQPLVAAMRLRVLDGRLAGAEHRLPDGRAVRVGHAFENDIVLRGPNTRKLAVELHVDGASVLIRMVSGSMIVLGRTLEAGQDMLLPAYLPVRLGDYAFAIGNDDEARWADAVGLVDDCARAVAVADAKPRADIVERVGTRLGPQRNAVAGWLRRPMLMTGVGAAILVALGSAVVSKEMFSTLDDTPAGVSRSLATAGFGSLSVSADPAGETLLVTGLVRDDEEERRLRAMLAERAPGAVVTVESSEGMASAATDLLASQGVDASARPGPANSLIVTTEYMPGDRQVELAALVKRDLPLIRSVQFRTNAARGAADLKYFFNSPQYGAVSFVDGEAAHIETADGSLWFNGAVLPTGHRIVEIGNGRLLLERAGRIETLRL